MPKGEKSFHHAGKERAALLAAAAVFSVVRRRGTNNSKLRILMSQFFSRIANLCLFVRSGALWIFYTCIDVRTIIANALGKERVALLAVAAFF